MNEPQTPHPLADQALSRLRKLAEGNGLAPDKVALIEAKENVYKLQGVLQLVPFCEPGGARYPGPPRGKDRTVLPDVAALHSEAQRRQREFLDKRDWLPAALDHIKSQPGQGWGMDGIKIALPEKSAILAAVETCPACQGRQSLACPQCQGQGSLICPQCGGRAQELCWICGGRGTNPGHPDQPCPTCMGRRYAPCRNCRASGKLPCPNCQGAGNLPCPQCNATGQLTEEIALACGATAHFKLSGEGIPSGLRRGLDRLGIANLAKGHADIVLLPPPKKESDDGTPPPDLSLLRYEAMLPYADLKMRFGDSNASLINVFGKRAAMLDVPPFLDDALQPARDYLKRAARGTGPIEAALAARAMRDALALELAGQGEVKNLRRIYPVGLSPTVAQEILSDMRAALNLSTRHTRAIASLGGGALGTAALGALLLTSLHANLTEGWPWSMGLLFDLAILTLVMGLCWTALGKSVQLTLKRRFPKRVISLHANAGRLGEFMLAGIGIAWIVLLMLAPVKPLWFSYLMAAINHM